MHNNSYLIEATSGEGVRTNRSGMRTLPGRNHLPMTESGLAAGDPEVIRKILAVNP